MSTDPAVAQAAPLDLADGGTPVPPQWKPVQLYDFRHATGGPRGFKHKRKREMDELEEQAQTQSATMDTAEPDKPGQPQQSQPRKRAKLNTVGLGKASGRPWKEPSKRASALSSIKPASWDQKMQAKRQNQLFQQHRKAAVEARIELKRAARQRRETAKTRKEENRKKSAVTQKISSHATVRKMMKSKKGRKQLQVADTVPPA